MMKSGEEEDNLILCRGPVNPEFMASVSNCKLYELTFYEGLIPHMLRLIDYVANLCE